MRKYFLLMVFLSQITYAQELKLECNLIIETRYSEGGRTTQQNTVATVEVDMNNLYKFIKIENHKIIAVVSSIKTDNTVSFVDRSDNGTWDLARQGFDSQKNERTSTSIRIDRNTGKIFFNNRFTDSTGYTNWSGAGDCSKVDVSKRKF